MDETATDMDEVTICGIVGNDASRGQDRSSE